MKRLGTAVQLLAAGIVLLLAWEPRRSFVPETLVLPAVVHVIPEGPDPDGFCRSTVLRHALFLRTFQLVYMEGQAYSRPDDFTVGCGWRGETAVLTVRDWKGRPVTRAAEPFGTPYGTAYLLARALGKDPALVAAALGLYRDDARAAARKGAEEFAAGDWTKSAEDLFYGLESDVEPAVLYFGLYADHAHLGHPKLALWYLLCYLGASGRAPEALTDEQLRPLSEPASAGAAAKALFEADPAPGMIFEMLAAYRRRRINDLYHLDERAAKESPWNVPAYAAVVRVQELVGWDALAGVWRARRDLAARTNAQGPELTARVLARLYRTSNAKPSGPSLKIR